MSQEKTLAIYTLDSRAFIMQHGLWLKPFQRFLELIIPRRILRTGGPRSVLESLVIGAMKSSWRVVINPPLKKGAFEHSINLSRTDLIASLSSKKNDGLIKKLLIGPNIDLKSLRNIELIHEGNYDSVLVPSKWANHVFNEWPPSSVLRTNIWDAGVDTDYWKPYRKSLKSGYLIYKKGEVDPRLLSEIASYLESKGPVRTLQYGKHSKREFRREVDKSQAVIWLGSTETQGIALCEIWSLDVPTLVLERPWRHVLGKSWPSSSAPYLSESTGKFIRTIEDVKVGISHVEARAFRPRIWVLNNQSAEESFKRLVRLLNE